MKSIDAMMKAEELMEELENILRLADMEGRDLNEAEQQRCRAIQAELSALYCRP